MPTFPPAPAANLTPLAYRQSTDDYIPLGTDSSGNLLVAVTGAGSGGTSSVDETDFSAGVTAGTPIMGYDPTSGELLVVELSPGTRVLQVAGSFSSTPPTSSTSTAPSRQTVSGSSGEILAANGSRKGCAVQNVGTVPVYLGLGQTPTASAYHIALPACGTSNDGSSSRWDGTLSGVLWQGAVNAITASGGGAIVATELT